MASPMCSFPNCQATLMERRNLSCRTSRTNLRARNRRSLVPIREQASPPSRTVMEHPSTRVGTTTIQTTDLTVKMMTTLLMSCKTFPPAMMKYQTKTLTMLPHTTDRVKTETQGEVAHLTSHLLVNRVSICDHKVHNCFYFYYCLSVTNYANK